MATFPAKTNYAAGDILTAAQMVDIGNQLNDLWSNDLVNPIINGGFDIWQRGTSIAVNGGYNADRWGASSGASNRTVSRQTTSDTTNLPFIQYCARVARDSGNTNTTYIDLVQSLETTNAIPYAGKTVTLSFYARKGANYSATNSVLNVYLISGTGTDQNRTSSLYTGEAYPILNQSATLTTTWQRFAFSGTLGATVTEFAPLFRFTPTGTAGAADYFEITGVQIDTGTFNAASVPPFRRAGGTLAGELAACQRYYWRFSGSDDSVGTMYYGSGFTTSTTAAQIWIQNPVPMRVRPASIDALNLKVSDSTTDATATAVIGWNGRLGTRVDCTFTGLTANRPALLFTSTTAGYLGFSAEL